MFIPGHYLKYPKIFIFHLYQLTPKLIYIFTTIKYIRSIAYMLFPFRDPLLLVVHINELMDMMAKFKIYHVFNIFVTCSQK